MHIYVKNNYALPSLVVTLCDNVDTYGKTLMIDASDTSMVNSSCTCQFSTTSPGAIRIYTETDEAHKRCGTYVETRIEQPASLYTRDISECTEHETFLYSNTDMYDGHVTIHRNQEVVDSDFNQCVQLDFKGICCVHNSNVHVYQSYRCVPSLTFYSYGDERRRRNILWTIYYSMLLG